MTKQITPNDLLCCIYHETSGNERTIIEQAIETEWELNEEYQCLLQTKFFLGKPKYAPSQSCIHAILKYSREYHRQENPY